MKFVEDDGSVNLSQVVTKGLPTLGVGKYVGQFIGTTIDKEDKQWITVVCHSGPHTEQSSLDVSKLEKNDDVYFEIEARDGAVAILKGNKYKLVQDGSDLTEFMELSKLYDYIKENEIVLAEPKLSLVSKVVA